jgi:pantothenate kinase
MPTPTLTRHTVCCLHRHVVGLAGSPGSGKTTTASEVVSRVNALASAAGVGDAFAALLPMDGFHLTRAQLDAMPDPKEAHRRRGARRVRSLALNTRAVR